MSLLNSDSSFLKSIEVPGYTNLAEMSKDRTLYLVFLRHLGCVFSRETLANLAEERKMLEENNQMIVLVHMSRRDRAEYIFSRYGLENIAHISDPDRELYLRFGLKRGTFKMVFGIKVLWRAYKAAIHYRYGPGAFEGDFFQMPGIFLLRNNRIIARFEHKDASDTPDYHELLTCAEEASAGNLSEPGNLI